MDPPRTSPQSSSRRSYPNLHNLSLAPLSSKYPLDASSPPSPSEGDIRAPRTSYIAQKSAPTTPGILSLSQSRSSSRNGRHPKGFAYDGYFINPDAPLRDTGDIPKAKSTNTLHPGVSFAEDSHTRHHRRKRTAPLPIKLPITRHHTSEGNDEWLHRAGLAIAGETRDSKGQGWLIRRESSTSLVGQTDEYEEHPSHDSRHIALLSGEHLADMEFATFTPRMSRAGSKINSRVGSRVPSARQSRRGSRADLWMSTTGSKPQSARHSLDADNYVFDENLIEPDFVEGGEESDGDEEEIARLAREQGFGLGSWMDRLIGWTLFSVDEDGEESDEEEEEEEDYSSRPENMTKEELKLRREVDAKRRKLEREAIIAAAAVSSPRPKDMNKTDDEDGATPSEPRSVAGEEGAGWQADAAWLFGVASKVLL